MRRDDDSSTSSDFMSPFAPLRATFPTPKVEGETLPANKDSSWISARMSPISFADDDVKNEDRHYIAPYHKALRDSSFSNERTALLGHRGRSRPVRDEEDGVGRYDGPSHKTESTPPRCSWDKILCALSGAHLGCMALHDAYIWYLHYRLGYRLTTDIRWRLPWLSPSVSTLRRFGALIPWNVIHGEAWRMVSSVFLCTSVAEFVFMCCAWHVLRDGGSRPTSAWVGLYFLSIITGDFWTIAWDPYSVSGGALWGTCGVLCAAGAAKPRQRFILLLISITLFVVTSIGATSSALGTMGSSVFGWLYFGMGHILVFRQERVAVLPPSRSIRTLSGVIIVSLWLVPLLWIAFSDTYHAQYATQPSR